MTEPKKENQPVEPRNEEAELDWKVKVLGWLILLSILGTPLGFYYLDNHVHIEPAYHTFETRPHVPIRLTQTIDIPVEMIGADNYHNVGYIRSDSRQNIYLYLTDDYGDVLLFLSPEGDKRIIHLEKEKWSPGLGFNTSAVAIDPKGRIVIKNGGRNSLDYFDANGKLVHRVFPKVDVTSVRGDFWSTDQMFWTQEIRITPQGDIAYLSNEIISDEPYEPLPEGPESLRWKMRVLRPYHWVLSFFGVKSSYAPQRGKYYLFGPDGELKNSFPLPGVGVKVQPSFGFEYRTFASEFAVDKEGRLLVATNGDSTPYDGHVDEKGSTLIFDSEGRLLRRIPKPLKGVHYFDPQNQEIVMREETSEGQERLTVMNYQGEKVAEYPINRDAAEKFADLTIDENGRILYLTYLDEGILSNPPYPFRIRIFERQQE